LPARVLVAVPPAPPAVAGGAFGALPEVPFPLPGPALTPPASRDGAASGPAGLPSRTAILIGNIRRSAVVVQPARSPGMQEAGHQANELGHGSILWRRPRYSNNAGLLGYMPPTKMPSWTANRVVDAGLPSVPVPVSVRSIVWATIQKEFGSDRQLFPLWGTRRPQPSVAIQGPRWQVQAKTSNPLTSLLTRYGLAPSYGSSTITLPTAPASAPAAVPTGMGAY